MTTKRSQLPSIRNKRPPATRIFDKFWTTRVSILRRERAGFSMLPYDGVNTLNAPSRISVALDDDKTLSDLVDRLYAECRTRAGKDTDPKGVSVDSPRPDAAATITAIFEDGPFVLRDLFGVMETDETVAQLMGELLTWLAAKTAE